MKQFWLVRHGESESNIGLPDPSREGSKLSPRGWEQVRAVVDHLPEPDLIVSSPFVRARESAEPLRARFPDVATATWQVQEFCPLADSYYTNVAMESRLATFRDFFDIDDPEHRCDVNTETFTDCIQRVNTLFDNLRASNMQQIVVFTHGTFLRMVLWQKMLGGLGNGVAAFGRFQKTFSLPNTAFIRGQVDNRNNIFLSGIVTDHLN